MAEVGECDQRVFLCGLGDIAEAHTAGECVDLGLLRQASRMIRPTTPAGRSSQQADGVVRFGEPCGLRRDREPPELLRILTRVSRMLTAKTATTSAGARQRLIDRLPNSASG
jgi:hypothetical protein